MAWYVDGVNLSTLAFNVQNRSAGWKMPAKRGDNLVVPGRNGALYVPNKPYDVGRISLSMWAVGADEKTGVPPADKDSSRLCRDNLDKLSSLFAVNSRLLTVTQISSTAFGTTNVVTNPSMETPNSNAAFGSNAPVTVATNTVRNPSARSKASTAQITNSFQNPGLRNQTGFGNAFEQLQLDPGTKLVRSTQANVATNYFYPTNFEALTTGTQPGTWTAGTNCSVSVTAMSTADRNANPLGYTQMLGITATAALSANAQIAKRNNAFVAQNCSPSVRFRLRRVGSGTTARTIQVRLTSTNDSGTAIATSALKTITVPTGGSWVDVTYSNTDYTGFSINSANDGSTRVEVNIRCGEAWASGEGIYVDQMLLTSSSYMTGQFAGVVDPFWDGDADWLVNTGPNGSGWESTTDTSVARWYARRDTRWSANTGTGTTGANSAFFNWAEAPWGDAGTVLSFVAMGYSTAAANTQQFVYTCAAPTAGINYTLRFSARGVTPPVSGQSYTVELLRKGASDSSYSVVGSTVFSAANGNLSGTGFNNGGTRMLGPFTPAVGPTVTAQAGDSYQIRVTVPVRTDGWAGFQLNNIGLDNYPYAVPTGDNNDTTNTQWSWSGTQYNSKSLGKMRQLNRMAQGTNQVVTNTVNGNATMIAETFCTLTGQAPLVQTNPVAISAVQGVYARAEAIGVLGTDATRLGTANPQAQISVTFLDASNAVTGTVTGSSATLSLLSGTAGTSTALSCPVPPANVPANSTQCQVQVALVNPIYQQGLEVANVLISNSSTPPVTGGAPDFFDGTSTNGSWTGTANDSASQYWISWPTQWSVPLGIPYPSAIAAVTAYGAATATGQAPSASLSASLGATYPAQAVQVYAEIMSGARNSSNAVITATNYPINAVLGFYNGSTLVNSVSMGQISSKEDSFKIVQGTATASGSFTDIRLTFTSTSTVPVNLTAKVNRMSVVLDGASWAPATHRISFNQISNGDFNSGLDFWTTGGTTPTPVTTTRGPGYTLSASTTMTSNTYAATAGSNYHCAVWGAGIQAALQFLSSGGAVLSTVNLTPHSSASENLQSIETTAPASTATARVYLTSPAGGEVAFVYSSVDTALHPDAGTYNPQTPTYFDGTDSSSVWGINTAWSGTTDQSASLAQPFIPGGWIFATSATSPNVHMLPSAAQTSSAGLPTGTTGSYIAGLARQPKNGSATYRTTGYSLGSGNAYVSGEIAVLTKTGASATVGLYGAATSTGAGTLLASLQTVTSGSNTRVVFNDVPCTGYGFAYLQIVYSESMIAPGYRVLLDNFGLYPTKAVLAGDYPGYFDGRSTQALWTGNADASTTTYAGGGRSALAEVKEAVDFTSMAGGTRAEFVVDMEIPGAFWSALTQAVMNYSVPVASSVNANNTLNLTSLAQMTAPIDDALITITPSANVTNVTLTDVASNASLTIASIAANQTVTISNKDFTVTQGGSSIIGSITRAGSNQLIPITPFSYQGSLLNPVTAPSAPQLSLTATGSGTIALVVTATPRYVLA